MTPWLAASGVQPHRRASRGNRARRDPLDRPPKRPAGEILLQTHRTARYRRATATIAVAALAMVAAGIFGIPVAKSLSSGGFQDPTSEWPGLRSC